jgi:hypothetical protein
MMRLCLVFILLAALACFDFVLGSRARRWSERLQGTRMSAAGLRRLRRRANLWMMASILAGGCAALVLGLLLSEAGR